MNFNKEIILEFLSKNDLCTHDEKITFTCIYKDDRDIYRVSCNNINYIYKTIGSSRKSLDEFEIEFNLMKLIWESSKGNVAMPQPLLLIENNGFLMTECSGITLKDEYYSSLFKLHKRSNVKNTMDLLGKWLGSFHLTTLNEAEYFDCYTNRRNNLIRMVESVALVSNDNVSSVMDEVVSYFDKVNAVDNIEFCQLHGNFALRNIIVDNNHVSLIDFEDSKKDCIYYDIGMFIAELMNKSILLFNTFYNNQLVQLFTLSYAAEIKFNKKILDSYILYHLVSSYYEVVNRQKPSSKIKSIFLSYKKYYNLRLIKSVLANTY